MKKLPKKGRIDLGFSFGDSIVGFESKLRLPSDEQIKNSQDWDDGEIQSERSTSISPWRLVPIYVIFAFLIIILGARAFNLQLIEGASFLNKSEGNHVLVKVDHAARGIIYDRNGKPLVLNTPGFRIAVRKIDLPKGWESSIGEIAQMINVNSKSLIDKINKNNEDQVTLATDLSNDQIISLETKADKYPWLDIEIYPERNYLFGQTVGSLLGYTSEASPSDLKRTDTVPYSSGDQVGKAGIEASFESTLRGANGYSLTKVNSTGKSQGTLFQTKPVAGTDINLSIDIDLQKFIYNDLVKVLQDKGGEGGSVVVMNPNTGEVLALVSVPSYDDNLFSKPISTQDYNQILNQPGNPLLNRAIATAYPPGSTFKMFVGAEGLESGVIKPDTKINDPGFITLDGVTFNNWLYLENHRTEGQITIARALARSTDTFFYQLGLTVGIDRLAPQISNFGFGQPTGIQLPGEISGLAPTPAWKQANIGQAWFPGDTVNYSIGQGYVLTTPLQLTQATAVFANGGKLISPTILKTNTPTIVRQNFLKSETIDTIKEGMYEDQIGDGNVGYLFNNYKIKTAGKTGSAQAGGDFKPDAWYTAFAPFDKPQIVVTVMVEKGGHGADLSAPLTRDIFNYYFKL